MKRTFITILGLVLVIIGISAIVSCEKSAYYNKNTFLNAKEIGVIHNKVLSKVYEDLKELKISKDSLSVEEYIKLAIQKSKEYTKQETNLSEQSIVEIYEKIGIYYIKTISDTNKLANTTDSLISNMEDVELKSLLERIKILLKNDLGSYEALDCELSKIEEDAKNGKYYDVIIAITSVARNSYLYWENNYQKWIELFLDDKNAEKIDPRFWDIMGADVNGAVSGAGIGASIAGVGAIAGALIGAPVASGAHGILIALKEATR